jgi:diguanylate cyclase (GGDEF)-like protein
MTPEINRRITDSTPDSRRRRLLHCIVISLVILCAASLILILFLPPDPAIVATYVPLLLVVFALCLLAFVFTRTGHVTIASWLLSAVSVVAPWWAILTDPTAFGHDVFSFSYLGISVLICAMLLPTVATIIVAVLHTAGLIAVAIAFPVTASYNWVSLCLFVITSSLISVFYAGLNRADMKQTRELLHLVSENERKILDLSLRDPLTGVWNRRFMEDSISRECSLASRSGHDIAFVMADLDRFKSINDRFGHPIGDLILIAVAKAILSSLRESDLVYRYGGDEFLILLPDTDRDSADQVLLRIRAAVAAFPLPAEMAGEPPIRLTCGLAVSTNGHADSSALLAAADKELYRIKGGK